MKRWLLIFALCCASCLLLADEKADSKAYVQARLDPTACTMTMAIPAGDLRLKGMDGTCRFFKAANATDAETLLRQLDWVEDDGSGFAFTHSGQYPEYQRGIR